MPEQLTIRYPGAWSAQEAHPLVMEEIRRVANAVGLKQVAFDLDTTPSYLSNALAERERHYLRVEWVLYFISRDPTTKLLEAIADVARCDVVRRRELTPAEELDRIKTALSELGPELRDLVRRKAGL